MWACKIYLGAGKFAKSLHNHQKRKKKRKEEKREFKMNVCVVIILVQCGNHTYSFLFISQINGFSTT